MENHVGSPDAEVFAEVQRIAEGENPPVLMLNQNRYTPKAGYPDGEAYLTYMRWLEHAVGSTGGSVLWRTPVNVQVLGCEHERYDEILAVWYPSYAAFLSLMTADGADEMFAGRAICVEHAVLLALPGDRDPLQPH